MRGQRDAKPERRLQTEAGASAVVTSVDEARTVLAITLEATVSSITEDLQTMAVSIDGAPTVPLNSYEITAGKRLRIQSIFLHVEGNGADTTPKRAYLRLRSNPSGAATTASPLQLVLAAATNQTVVNASGHAAMPIPDGFELPGDGNREVGFTLECPDYVASLGTMKVKASIIAFER